MTKDESEHAARQYDPLIGYRLHWAECPPPKFPAECPRCFREAVNLSARLNEEQRYACGGRYWMRRVPAHFNHTIYFDGECGGEVRILNSATWKIYMERADQLVGRCASTDDFAVCRIRRVLLGVPSVGPDWEGLAVVAYKADWRLAEESEGEVYDIDERKW